MMNRIREGTDRVSFDSYGLLIVYLSLISHWRGEVENYWHVGQ